MPTSAREPALCAGLRLGAVAPSAFAMAATSAGLGFSASAVDGIPEIVAVPGVQAPWPAEPVRVKVDGPLTATVKTPFAAVLPSTPLSVTCIPVCKWWGDAVVITMGGALEIAVILGPAMAVFMSGGTELGGSHAFRTS